MGPRRPAVQLERLVLALVPVADGGLAIADISTPILVIHGDRDYRVPVGEALRLWADLTSRGKTAKFLYFPDENHWILRPGDVPVWYETVLAFLAEHVRGEKWQRPGLL